jgi:hypothetical protein
MIFGDRNAIAIEIGDIIDYEHNGIWLPFKFVVDNIEFGDFEGDFGIIPLSGCAGYLHSFLENREYRVCPSVATLEVNSVFKQLFTEFYESEYGGAEQPGPNLRDRYHLSEVGMEAVIDKCAILMVDVDEVSSRIIVKDYRADRFVVDKWTKTSEFEEMANGFLAWARSQGWKPCIPKLTKRQLKRL